MAKQQTDEELNIKRKARRRLIGAIALTLAVVVILPMVLDSEPKPTGEEIDLRIPDPDKAGEFVPGVAVSEVPMTLPLADTIAVTPPVAVSAVPAAAQADPAAAPVKDQPAADQSQQTKAADKKDATAPESYVAQVGAYSNADTAKQELDKLKQWGFKAYTEKAGDKIRVRVGPYTEREKVEKVRQLLEKHGLHPSIISVK